MTTKKTKAKASENKTRGRPKKTVQRECRISIRVTAEELEHANKIAAKQKKSLANFVRHAFGLEEDSYGQGE